MSNLDPFACWVRGLGRKWPGTAGAEVDREAVGVIFGLASTGCAGCSVGPHVLAGRRLRRPTTDQVLLMDEPCSALDPISTLAIEELIIRLKSDYTIVIVTRNCSRRPACPTGPRSSTSRRPASRAG